MSSLTSSRDRQSWTQERLAVYWFVALVVLTIVTSALLWNVELVGGLLVILLWPLLVVSAFALAIRGSVGAWRHRRSGWRDGLMAASPLIVVLVGAIAVQPIGGGVGFALTWSKFLLNRHRYERIIAEVERGEIAAPANAASTQRSIDGIPFEAERGLPHRVAFVLPDHWLSDRQAIYYDPTRGRSAKLFDGWLAPYDCSPLVGLFYSCWLSPK